MDDAISRSELIKILREWPEHLGILLNPTCEEYAERYGFLDKAGLKSCTTGKTPGYGCNISCPYLNTPNCWLPVKRDALALIERLEAQQPKWISVKDQLPDSRRNILTVNGHGVIRIMALWGYAGDKWKWIEGKKFKYYNDITHWMPLPEPPEEASP